MSPHGEWERPGQPRAGVSHTRFPVPDRVCGVPPSWTQETRHEDACFEGGRGAPFGRRGSTQVRPGASVEYRMAPRAGGGANNVLCYSFRESGEYCIEGAFMAVVVVSEAGAGEGTLAYREAWQGRCRERWNARTGPRRRLTRSCCVTTSCRLIAG